MSIHCISFGYKYGIPTDSDLVFDVRCLPNPFYEDALKDHTGMERSVFDFVMKWEQAQILIEKLYDLYMPSQSNMYELNIVEIGGA